MKNSIFVLLLLLSFASFSQSLEDYNAKRLDLSEKQMIVLGTWSVGNLIVNPILASNASGSDKYFYNMNTYWNAVNLAFAGLGYWAVKRAGKKEYSLEETLKEQRLAEKLLLFNAGLDLAYVMGGLYMLERGRNDKSDNPERLEGFGKSIMLQGAWLFAYDIVFYILQNNLGNKLIENLNGLALGPNGFSFRYKIK